MVTFWFVDEYKVKQFVSLPAFEFIGRLVGLIPEKNLKLICYYGLYSRRTFGCFRKFLRVLVVKLCLLSLSGWWFVVLIVVNLWVLWVCLGLMVVGVWFMRLGVVVMVIVGKV
jgi:hypothetical protein